MCVEVSTLGLCSYLLISPPCIYASIHPSIHPSFHRLLKSILFSSGPPSAPLLSCLGLSQNVSGGVNVTVSWTLSGWDSTDFYLINITTNAPQTPHGGVLNITGSATQCELTDFETDYQYNITVHGVNCLNQEGGESEPLILTPQSKSTSGHLFTLMCMPAASDREKPVSHT